MRGLSDEAFREAFGTKEQCRAALVRLRWPDGFVCPCCGHRGHCVLAGRGLYQCNRCKKQTSPTAGTIFHATKLPLTLWFAAIHLIRCLKLLKLTLSILNCFLYVFVCYWHGVSSATASTPLYGTKALSSHQG